MVVPITKRLCEICAVFRRHGEEPPAEGLAELRVALRDFHARVASLVVLTDADCCHDPKHLEHCGYATAVDREFTILECLGISP